MRLDCFYNLNDYFIFTSTLSVYLYMVIFLENSWFFPLTISCVVETNVLLSIFAERESKLVSGINIEYGSEDLL